MNTRRDFVRGLTGIGAIVATGHAPAIVKSMIAARGTVLGGAHAWTNPYVTEGLVAMWDGEWNAGGGEHDATATTWKNLVSGGVDATSIGGNIWSSNYVSGGNGFMVAGAIFSGLTAWTVEAAWVTSSEVNGHVAVIGKARGYNYGGSGLGRWDNSNLIYGAVGGVNITWDRAGYGARTSSLRTNGSTAYLDRNGVQSGSQAVSDTNLATWSGISTWYLAGATNTGQKNKFHCIRIYNRFRTLAEISANHAIDKKRFDIT